LAGLAIHTVSLQRFPRGSSRLSRPPLCARLCCPLSFSPLVAPRGHEISHKHIPPALTSDGTVFRASPSPPAITLPPLSKRLGASNSEARPQTAPRGPPDPTPLAPWPGSVPVSCRATGRRARECRW